jgi:hypothetical protein
MLPHAVCYNTGAEDDSLKQLLEELLFLTCTAGSQAVLQPKLQVTAAAMQDLIDR